jgi:antitoxin component YwqK of YwqJK toxin-antitoxin module
MSIVAASAAAAVAAAAASEEETLCYICYDGHTAENPFLEQPPCKCRGSLHLHLNCYNKLCDIATEGGKIPTCSICKTKYNPYVKYIRFDELNEDGYRWRGNRHPLTGAYDGLLTVYHTNGNHWFVVEYANEQRNGPYVEWHEDGTYHTNAYYEDGELHGAYQQYWQNGEIRVDTTYMHGEFDGLYQEFSQTGQLLLSQTYVNGIRHGPAITYYEGGGKKRQANYYYGQLDGEEFLYYESGNLESHTTYLRDDIIGVVTTYHDAPNSVETIITYSNGVQRNKKVFNDAGSCIKEFTYRTA